MIVVLDAGRPGLLDDLRRVRADGDVPLVGDPRWPAAQWAAVRALAATAEVPEGTAWATLTSGSSGAPRVVLRSDASWARSYAAVASLLDAGPEDVVALPGPASSSLTLYSLAQVLAGGPRVAVGPVSPDATHLHGTPEALRAALEAHPASRLRVALVGGSHLDPALRARAEERGIRVHAYYGAAELSFVALDDGSGMGAFPGVELSIRDGVLWVRSPFTALGYARPSAGHAASAGYDGSAGPSAGPLRFDGDWATVGDRAELVQGRLRLLGRADDAVLSASATIVPEEVEAVLRSVPGVRDAVVFGMPQARVGALVAALIERNPPAPPLSDLRRAASRELAPAHRPRLWFTGEVPRTASGKPARAEIARRAEAGELERLVH
ncbi:MULTISPECIES: class I adenylate-forming enzyme family protein [unclassified Leifsonia]|uniref:class I adenylate-forming enzyme family protein n=1 Tax=unclassified Leifsonia TaxID=2663824 RepID=UPI0008A7849B|nr:MULTISPECIES: class I adenylate-forming enzyme family protein [unclassified Leifsonia]SEH67183.1 Acyl-CoA synthetase (AMP-forming)/AMP-acid ligase II [Leifsonia sp. CL154]SFL28850.1 Acyl-CoA synthetase (AMP-forming)/AMP-acid ligase II [Leifsonia sp. CL147]